MPLISGEKEKLRSNFCKPIHKIDSVEKIYYSYYSSQNVQS